MDSLKKEYESEIKKNNFVRALYLAKELNISDKEIKELFYKALWEVAGKARNPYATKRLAEDFGYSKEEVKEILTELSKKEEESGNKKIIAPCYDYRSGKYLPFDKWLEQFLKEWNKIN